MEQPTLILVLAFLIEGIVEYSQVGTIKLPGWAKLLISFVLGIVICIGYRINMLEILGATPSGRMGDFPLGEILTGLIIGRGSNFVHDAWTRIRNGGLPVRMLTATIGERVQETIIEKTPERDDRDNHEATL